MGVVMMSGLAGQHQANVLEGQSSAHHQFCPPREELTQVLLATTLTPTNSPRRSGLGRVTKNCVEPDEVPVDHRGVDSKPGCGLGGSRAVAERLGADMVEE